MIPSISTLFVWLSGILGVLCVALAVRAIRWNRQMQRDWLDGDAIAPTVGAFAFFGMAAVCWVVG